MLSYLIKCCPIVFVASVLAFGCCATSQASARTFGGYDCTDDCVGHAAGYRWAEEREIENIDDCPENRSEAFYEGCLTYVDDPERGADYDDDGRAIVVPRRSSAPGTAGASSFLSPFINQDAAMLAASALVMGTVPGFGAAGYEPAISLRGRRCPFLVQPPLWLTLS